MALLQHKAAARWKNSGMSVMDYIRSCVEEGDPEFDLDWETAREIEHDVAMGRFQAGNRAMDGAAQDGQAAKFSVGNRPYNKKQNKRNLNLSSGNTGSRATGARRPGYGAVSTELS